VDRSSRTGRLITEVRRCREPATIVVFRFGEKFNVCAACALRNHLHRSSQLDGRMRPTWRSEVGLPFQRGSYPFRAAAWNALLIGVMIAVAALAALSASAKVGRMGQYCTSSMVGCMADCVAFLSGLYHASSGAMEPRYYRYTDRSARDLVRSTIWQTDRSRTAWRSERGRHGNRCSSAGAFACHHQILSPSPNIVDAAHAIASTQMLISLTASA
jgi:hypothetical protein